MNAALPFFATVPLGIEYLLARELTELGASEVQEAKAGVAFGGDLEMAYKVCLWSRLANRVLMPLDRFAAFNPDELYAGIRSIDWSLHLDTACSIAVDFACGRSAITHSLYGAQTVKDAIVDQFRARDGSRPSVDLARPDVRINVYLNRDLATVSLDLSGDSLHKRGYRLDGGKAPLKENLAAAILLRAGWPEIAAAGGAFVDPMCGSGTLPIEAALMAADVAPGLLRPGFGFMGWLGHDSSIWLTLASEAEQRAEAGLKNMPTVVGYDLDREAVHHALDNIERAGLSGKVHVERKSMVDARPRQDSGLIIANPPYGERLGDETTLEPLYRQLGQLMKDHFQGWRASVFTGNTELAFKVGIRAKRHFSMLNGALQCKLFNFEIQTNSFFTPREGGPPTEAEREQRILFRKARSVDVTTGGAVMLANRLTKNLKNIGRWASQNNIDCYRLYDADLPEYSFALDVYQGEKRWVHVQEYEAPSSIDPDKAEARLVDALAVIPGLLEVPTDQVFLKVRRRQKGAAQYEKQGESEQFFKVREAGLEFWVNFENYLDTGLFLDHRMTRALIRDWAKGKSFLNLFAYTGSATVYAGKGGAISTTTVDLSRTYLEWAERNLELNGLRGDRHQVIQADCLDWIKQAARTFWRYDLIFLDPPTFSTSKRMQGTLDIQRDHVDLIYDCLELLAPGGRLVFSNNHRKFKFDREAFADYRVEDLSRRTLPKDFERNPRIHGCWLIEAD